MSNLGTIVLAAGMGTRMKSKIPKVLHKVCGKEMINWVIDAALESGIEKIAVVIGNEKEQVENAIKKEVKYFEQKERLGTGHAVMQCDKFLEEENLDDIVVLYGDVPLLSKETIKNAYKVHKDEGNIATVITCILDNPKGYGRIIKDKQGMTKGIVEQKDANEEQKKIKEVNSGIVIFNRVELINALSNITNNNAQSEYYLTDTIKIIYDRGLKIGTYICENTYEVEGVNDRVMLAYLEKIAKDMIVRNHQMNGVTIQACESVYIEKDVKIERDVTLLANTRLLGNTVIKEDAVIGPDSEIENSTIGEGTHVKKTVVIDSSIGKNTKVGPFAYIRPLSEIGDEVKIGDFVEIKKAKIGNGTKISHLTYIGDAIVGENCNFGCGVVVVNYDGKNKHVTKVGDRSFVGCNVNLVSPVIVEDDTYIAAGSTITNTVPKHALAIARARQTNKENWVINRNMLRK